MKIKHFTETNIFKALGIFYWIMEYLQTINQGQNICRYDKTFLKVHISLLSDMEI